MKITRWTVTIGLNDKDTKIQEISLHEAKKIINNLLVETDNDATIYEVDGVYTHEDGTKINEKSLQTEILFSSKRKVFEFAAKVKTMLNQESVVIKKDKIKSMLY